MKKALKSNPTDPATVPIEDVYNLGPKSAQWLRDAGIETLWDLKMIGAVEAYRRTRKLQPKVSILLLYAMYGALHDRHWNSLTKEERLSLRQSVSPSG